MILRKLITLSVLLIVSFAINSGISLPIRSLSVGLPITITQTSVSGYRHVSIVNTRECLRVYDINTPTTLTLHTTNQHVSYRLQGYSEHCLSLNARLGESLTLDQPRTFNQREKVCSFQLSQSVDPRTSVNVTFVYGGSTERSTDLRDQHCTNLCNGNSAHLAYPRSVQMYINKQPATTSSIKVYSKIGCRSLLAKVEDGTSFVDIARTNARVFKYFMIEEEKKESLELY